jgi:chemotaxis protein histidine kinase CheA
MMEGDSNFIGSRKLYIAGTRQRAAGMIRSLLSMQDDCQGQIGHLLQQLHAQTEASRSNGFDSVARLCQSMGDCLARIDSYEKPQSEAAISALIESCQVISEHAETISKFAGGNMQACRWSRAITASSFKKSKKT